MRRTIGWRRISSMGLVVALGVWGCAAPDPNLDLIDQGTAAIEVDRPDAALAAADQFLQKSPGSPQTAQAHYIRGRAYEIKARREVAGSAGNLQSARTAYLEGLALKPGGRLEAYLRSGLANVAYFQDDFQTAHGQWQAAYGMVEDPELRAWMLYRMGLCQQRMSRFQAADQVFERVIRLYPNTDPARRAKEKQGARVFTLLLGTVATPQAAADVTEQLRGQGVVVTTTSESPGTYQLRVESLATYDVARQMKIRLAAAYPTAVILP